MTAFALVLSVVSILPKEESRAIRSHYEPLPKDQRISLRYLTFHPIVDPELLTAYEESLAFWLNSMSNGPRVIRPMRISSHVWALDIRDYGWHWNSYATVSKRSPYLLKESNDGGPRTIRGDWFLHETSDATLSDSYYQLLYDAGNDKRGETDKGLGKVPANAQDFRDAWAVDKQEVIRRYLATGAAVETGTSIVALSNRVLFRAPTILGAYHESYDSATGVGTDDFVERFLLEEVEANADAGEYITSLPNGGHGYLLAAGAERNRVDFADPAVARDSTDTRDSRVRTPRSCVICHSPPDGLHVPADAIRPLYADGHGRPLKYQDKVGLETFYLSDHNIRLSRDHGAYREFVRQCNGREPSQNGQQYQLALSDYERPVTLERAARELATTPDVLTTAVGKAKEAGDERAYGRVSQLVIGNGTVPREVWEESVYQTCYELLYQTEVKEAEHERKDGTAGE